MKNKNNVKLIMKKMDKGEKMIALLAPSFAGEFEFPQIVNMLRDLGFDMVSELTFGAKMINRGYYDLLKDNKELVIASPCPGIVHVVKRNYPKYVKNLACVDSPMQATAKISKKHFPKHKTVFLSPCDYKKIEASQSKYVDYVIDYEQLRELFKERKIKPSKRKAKFDSFYNDYTKIFPIKGGLAETAHLAGAIKKNEIKTVDGVQEFMKFLDKPDPKIRFVDALFCLGGCIGGPHTRKDLSIRTKRKNVLAYRDRSMKKAIPKKKKGLVKKAEGIEFNTC